MPKKKSGTVSKSAFIRQHPLSRKFVFSCDVVVVGVESEGSHRLRYAHTFHEVNLITDSEDHVVGRMGAVPR